MTSRLYQLSIASSIAITGAVVAIQPAQAITFKFGWTGEAGYHVRGTFGYDEATAPTIISEAGAGPTNTLDFLSVAFFDPAQNPLQSFNTVKNGVSDSSFFEFNFDTTTRSLFGFLDVGGGPSIVGIQFFQGTLGGLLELRELGPQADIILDAQNPGVVTVTEQVPAPGAALGLGAMGLWQGCSRLRQRFLKSSTG